MFQPDKIRFLICETLSIVSWFCDDWRWTTWYQNWPEIQHLQTQLRRIKLWYSLPSSTSITIEPINVWFFFFSKCFAKFTHTQTYWCLIVRIWVIECSIDSNHKKNINKKNKSLLSLDLIHEHIDGYDASKLTKCMLSKSN
jgi:hypothetical protein